MTTEPRLPERRAAFEADYVIVGAGSAGSVLANRLTASGRHTVLLLEAGGSDRSFWIDLPIGYGRCFFDPDVNWMYQSGPDRGLDGRRGYWPRGKVLGGSSSINAMVFVRGHPADFDGWAEAGNSGWSWTDVLPYFKRLETAPQDEHGDRGTSGPLWVTDPSREHHPLCEAFYSAGRSLGFTLNAGFNGRSMEGIGPYEITAHRGRRMSAARAYLRPAMNRKWLTVVTRALASRIAFEGRRAVGITFRRHGRLAYASAKREVIICAGAINTPQLLQLSGVGPADVLARHGIPVVHEVTAVGRNLQDHLCIDHIYRARVPTLNQVLGTWHGRVRAGLDYVLRRRGPLAISINQAGGFVRSQSELPAPDMQLYFSPLSYTRPTPGERHLMRPDRFPGLLMSAQPCRPKSRGQIEVRSADPDDAPLIMPSSFSAPEDIEAMVRAAALLRRLAATPALAHVIEREVMPGPQVQSREAMIDDIRRRASTVFHPVGTCRMGPDPASSVVDARLRVHGLHGLRIIDASVFPTLTSGNTNAPVMMAAEKGADLVLADAD